MIGLYTLGAADGALGFFMLALKICLAGRLRIQVETKRRLETTSVAGVAQ